MNQLTDEQRRRADELLAEIALLEVREALLTPDVPERRTGLAGTKVSLPASTASTIKATLASRRAALKHLTETPADGS